MSKAHPRVQQPKAGGSAGYRELLDKVVELVSQDPRKAAIILTDWIKKPAVKNEPTPRPSLNKKKAA